MVKKIFLLFFLLGVAVAAFAAYDAYRFFHSPLSAPDRSFELHVKQGDTIRGISGHLAAAGFMAQPLWWEIYARYTGAARSVKAGEFSLNTALTPLQLLGKLQSSEQKQFAFTILEGWNIWQLRSALAKDEVLEHTMQSVDDADVMAFIGAQAGHPEGQFLPDTYYFPKGTTDAQFLLRAHMALVAELDQVWAQRAEGLPVTTAYEVIIMASIIEKETSIDAEREMVSGVISRRLGKGMRLQMDPTVIYGIGKQFNGNITRKDLRTKTPYNTYTIAGLPPTPIAMASARSLQAAVNPADSKALYFVADGTGGHVFSNTVEEHNKAVDKFIRKKK